MPTRKTTGRTVNAYADTEVSVTKSVEEIKRQLAKYGVLEVRTTERQPTELDAGALAFEFNTAAGLRVRIGIIIPPTAGLTQRQAQRAGQPEARVLFHLIKNKLAAVEYGVETVEQAFIAYLVSAGGGTMMEDAAAFRQMLDAGFAPAAALLPARIG